MSGGGEVTIWHNPACGTSRNVLAMIRAAGVEPNVVLYLKTPPTKAEIAAVAKAAGVPLRALVRETGTPFVELGLGSPGVSDDALLDAMVAHPILINRPIVISARGAALCRPVDKVLALLPETGAAPGKAEKPAGKAAQAPAKPTPAQSASAKPAPTRAAPEKAGPATTGKAAAVPAATKPAGKAAAGAATEVPARAPSAKPSSAKPPSAEKPSAKSARSKTTPSRSAAPVKTKVPPKGQVG